MLCLRPIHFVCYLELVQPQKTGDRPDITEELFTGMKTSKEKYMTNHSQKNNLF